MKTVIIKVDIEDEAKIQAVISYETIDETVKHTSVEFTEITPPTQTDIVEKAMGFKDPGDCILCGMVTQKIGVMKHTEDQIQAACVKWFRYQYPDVVIFAIPNGGLRGAREAARMKGTGTLAGVADLFVMRPKIERPKKIDQISHSEFYAEMKFFHGLFIEMKAGKNGMTEAQQLFRLNAINAGYGHVVCRSFDEFKETIEKYLGH